MEHSKERLGGTTSSQKITLKLVFCIISAIWGSFQFGYNTGVINAPQKVIESFINSTHFDRTGRAIESDNLTLIWSFTVAIFAIGGMVGGVTAGAFANKFGRKKGMLFNCVIGLIAAALLCLSKPLKSYEMIVVGRLIVGLSCGLFTGLVPMYLCEISPSGVRGALGTVNQLGVVIGILVSQVLGIPSVLGSDEHWPILLGLSGAAPILMLLMLPFCPESPRFLLITKHEEKDASEALLFLRTNSDDVDTDISEMKAEEESQREEAKITICQLLKSRSLRLPLVISVVMQLSQQLSGINAVFYYSNTIFENAGLSSTAAGYATIGVGAVMVVMTIVTVPLMDRAGRRTLHLVGLAGMFIFSVCVTIFQSQRDNVDWFSYLSVVSALLYVVFFALGPGSIPWLIVAELFSQGPRPAAVSIAVLVNWSCNFVVGQVFPIMEKNLESLSFIPFTVLLVGFIVFTFVYLPETKNRTFEEMSLYFKLGHFGPTPPAEDTSLVDHGEKRDEQSHL